MGQIGRLGLQDGSDLVLFYIHQMNHVNSYNNLLMMTAITSISIIITAHIDMQFLKHNAL